MKILLTGAAGFIASRVGHLLLNRGDEVVGLDSMNNAYDARLKVWRLAQLEDRPRFSFHRTDISDRASLGEVVTAAQPDAVINLAARAGVRQSIDDPWVYYETNVTGTLNLLELCHELGIPKFVLASTSSAYGDQTKQPFTEDMPLLLKSGGSTPAYKKAYEAIAGHYADRTGLEVVFPRPGGVYGPAYTSMVNIHSRLAHAAVQGVKGPLEGRMPNPHAEDPVQCCYVKDCARAIQMLQMAPKLNHREYNVTIGHLVSATDIAEAVKKVEPDFDYELTPGKGPRYIPDAYLDITRIREDIGFEPAYTLAETMEDYIGWLRSGNPN